MRYLPRPFLLVLLPLLLASCSSAPETPSNYSEPIVAASSTPAVFNSDASLTKTLDALLSEPEFNVSRLGVAVISLRDGKLIYQRNGDKSFTPASNMKIFTTAVALDLLGADYRWRTSVYATHDVDSAGTVNGDLVLYGRGAPDLVTSSKPDNKNSLEELARSLSLRGVRRVAGNVIGDESYFRGESIGEGWQWNDLQWYFGAEASALTVNSNSVDVSVEPPGKDDNQPKVSSSDSDGYVTIENNMKLVSRGDKFTLGVQKGVSDNNVTVWGEFPSGARGYGATLSVHRPSLWAARMFIRQLQAAGISVDGSAEYRDAKVPQSQRFDPHSSTELASVTGKSLGEVVHATNKLSINLYAELLLRTLGHERGALLQTEQPVGREQGDEEAGTALIIFWLARAGVSTNGLALHDGSGLSRLDLVTPEATAGLLAAIRRTTSAQVFTDSLPIAGTDGTLAGRLREFSGQIQAKTGLLTYDNALSGFVTCSDGQTLAFSIISNDFVGKPRAVGLIDRIVSVLAEHKNYPANAPTH
ncbi:MAG TPA: D-alanyl-D-alanine carboxypeptidase/D-alanyl-D-alanine-endopeptidase [Pyrinomonadaceae bacterium]|nr:D-alanyl-D-alanine carboxypeptidase/D-alanyl-D-alanine-endopeptidase [Pyrinomonadaceae bacterium]